MRASDELLIINDGSEDISDSNLLSLKKIDSRINIINKQHSGLVETLNLGIKESRNDLIARADVDDKYSPNRISIQTEFMSKNPNCAAVFSDYEIRSADNDVLGLIPTAISPVLTRFSLLNPQRTPHPSVMFRKSAVQSVGAYKIDDFPGEDLSLWIALSSSFEIATIPQTLLYYRSHKGNITNRFQNQMKEKTRTLISNHAKSLFIDDVLNDIEKSFAIYDANNNAMDRKILFLRDLVKYLKGTDKSEIARVIRHPAISSLRQVVRPSSVKSISQLKREQKRRKLNSGT
jgi:glycosyltransferase involved in cell wall biosynthesis